MPIWLRRFTFNEMREFYIKEKEEYDKATGNSQTMKTVDQLIKAGPTKIPDQKPTYTSKVSKKK